MESIAILNNLLPEENQLPVVGTLTKPGYHGGQTGRWFITVLKFCILGSGVGIVALAVSAQFVFIAPCAIVALVSSISLYYVRKLGKLESEAAITKDLNSLSEKISNFVRGLNNQVHQLGEGNHRFEEESENYKRTVEEGANKVREQLVQIEEITKELQTAESEIQEYKKVNEKLNDGVEHLKQIVEKFVQTQGDFSINVNNLGKEQQKIETHVNELDSEVNEISEENEDLVEGVSQLTGQVDKIEKMLQLVDERFSDLHKLKEQKESELEKLNRQGDKLLKGQELYRNNLEIQKKLNAEMQKKIEELEEKKREKGVHEIKEEEVKEKLGRTTSLILKKNTPILKQLSISDMKNHLSENKTEKVKELPKTEEKQFIDLVKPNKNHFQLFHKKEKGKKFLSPHISFENKGPENRDVSALDLHQIGHEEEKYHFFDKIFHFNKDRKKSQEEDKVDIVSPKKIKKKKKEKEVKGGNSN